MSEASNGHGGALCVVCGEGVVVSRHRFCLSVGTCLLGPLALRGLGYVPLPIQAVSLYTVAAACLAFWLGFAAVAAQTEGFSLRSQRRLFFALLLFVDSVTDPLGYLVRFFGRDVLLDLLD